MAFDPDAYLAGGGVDAQKAFDPDAYLSGTPSEPEPFDPDKYLQSPPAEPTANAPSLSGVSTPQGGLPMTEATDPGSLAFKDALEKAKSESALKAAGREAAMGVVPTLAGIGGGIGAGALAGTVAGPVGTVVGGLVGGIGAAVGADWLQGKAIEAIAPEQAAQLEIDRAAAAQVHPYATLAGSLAPQLLVMKPSLKNVAGAFKGAKALLGGTLDVATPEGKVLVDQLANVGLGAGVQGAQEAYAQYQAGDLNAGRLLAQIVAGAVVSEPNKFGVKMGLHPTTGEPELVEVPPVRAETPQPVPWGVMDVNGKINAEVAEATPGTPKSGYDAMQEQTDVNAKVADIHNELNPDAPIEPAPVEQGNIFEPLKQPPPAEPQNIQPSADTTITAQEGAVPSRTKYVVPETPVTRMGVKALREELKAGGIETTTRDKISDLRYKLNQNRTDRLAQEKRMQALETRAPQEVKIESAETTANRQRGQQDGVSGHSDKAAGEQAQFLEDKIRRHIDDGRYLNDGETVYDANGVEHEVVGVDRFPSQRTLGKDELTYEVRNMDTGETKKVSGAELSRELDRDVPFRTVLNEAKGGDAGRAKWIIRKTLGPDSPVEIVERIFEKGAERLGKYQAGLVTIAKGGNMERTAYHEAMHGAEDMLMTAKELDAVKRIQPDAEKRADAFMDYAAGKQGVTGQLKMYFDRMMYRIKKLFGTADGISELKSIHAKLMQGSMAKRGAKVGSGEAIYKGKSATLYHGSRDASVSEIENRPEGMWFTTNSKGHVPGRSRSPFVSKVSVDTESLKLANKAEFTSAGGYRGNLKATAEALKAKGYDGVSYTSDGDKHVWIFEPKGKVNTEGVEPQYRTPTAYDDVVKKFEAQEQANADKFKRKPSDIRKWFGRNWVSNTSPAELELRKTAVKGYEDWADPVKKVQRDLAAVRGATGEAREAMGEASERIWRANGIKTTEDMQHFNRLAQAKRVIEIDELKRGQAAVERQRLMDLDKSTGKTDTHWSPEDEAAFQQELKDFKSPISLEGAKAYVENHEGRADAKKFDDSFAEYQKEYKSLLKESLDAGIISKEVFDYLDKNHNSYQPRVFLDKIDPVMETRQGRGGTIEVRQSGIQSLKSGDEGAMIMDSPYLLMSKIIQTKTSIAKNKATKSLADYLASKPDALDAKLVTDMRTHIPAGKERITYREDGKQKAIDVNRDFAEAWRTSSPQMTPEAMKIMRYASGTAFVKFLATAGNPEFAVANLPRDLGFTFLSSKEFSPFMPVAAYQQLRNIAKQAISREVRRTLMKYYTKEGGSTDFLSTMGHLEDFHNPGAITQGRKTANKIIEILGYPGNTSEGTVRIAHFQQALRNLGHTDFTESGMARFASTPEGKEKIRSAVYAASNVLDFRQAGNMAKVVDQFVPFFNPAVQGARGVMRAFKERPAETSFRASQIIGLGALLAMYNRKTDEKAWESTSDVEKDTKAVFVTGITRKDSNGNDRHVYVAPAIDQGWRPFFIIGQMVGEKMMGKDVDPKRITDSINANYIPYDAANLPPVVAAILTYSQNHDFWRNEKVWRGAKVSPEMERRATTPALATLAGDVTGMSPERLSAAAGKLFPEHVASLALREAANKIAGEDNNNEGWLSVNRLPFARKLLRLTSSRDMTHDKELAAKRLGVKVKDRSVASVLNDIEKAEVKQNTYRQKNNVTFDKLVAKVRSGEMTKAELYKAAWQVKNDAGKFDGKERVRILRLLKKRYPELKIVAPSGE